MNFEFFLLLVAVVAVLVILGGLGMARSRQRLLTQQKQLRSELSQSQRHNENLSQELSQVQAALQHQQQTAQQLQSRLGQVEGNQGKLLGTVNDMTSVVEKNSITLAEVSWQAKAINKEMAQLASKGMQMAAASHC